MEEPLQTFKFSSKINKTLAFSVSLLMAISFPLGITTLEVIPFPKNSIMKIPRPLMDGN